MTAEAAAQVDPTEGGRWIVIDGRRWRATDPSIPEPLRQELVNNLMAARRGSGPLGAPVTTLQSDSRGRRLTTPNSPWGNGVNPGGNHRARAGVVGVPGPPFVR